MNQPGQHTPSNASSRSSSRPGLPHGLIGTSNVRATIRNSNRAPKYESASNQQAQRPQYSLARPFVSHTHVPSYVQPGYHELNPGYQEIQQAPLWGLAKPLPRVLRPGMRRQQEGAHGSRKPDVVENQQAEVEEPGSSEAIPQVGMINDQRNDAGKSSTRNGGVSSGERGYGNQDPAKMIRHPVAPRSRSDIVTPCEEKGNPMDVWKQNLTPDETPNPFVGYDDGDIGHARAQRLSNIYEFSSNEEFGGIHSRPAAHYALTEKSDEVDLENGDAVDWPVEKVDDEDHRTLAERDAYNRWSATRARFREPLAECLATMVAVLIGLCTSLSVVTSNNTAGSYQSENWAWGFGVMIGVYLAGGISGGHLNPAISLTLCLFRGFPFRKAAVYITAQVFGGFLAGLIAYGIYKPAIMAFNASGGEAAAGGGSSVAVDLFTGGSGKAFYTSPAPFAGPGSSFGNEFVASAILSCAILALGDDSNAPPGAGMHSFIVGLVVSVLTMAFGYTTGACLNPARDFGPRAAAAIVGYGSRVFTGRNIWWIYGAWGATITGGLIGGLLYDVLIFVGGESPVNYPEVKRKKAKKKAKRRWWGLRRGITMPFKRLLKLGPKGK